MKVGDVVISTKIRPGEKATIIDAEFVIKEKEGKGKHARTKYLAEYEDGSLLKFHGASIGHTIFKYEESYEQMTLEDFGVVLDPPIKS